MLARNHEKGRLSPGLTGLSPMDAIVGVVESDVQADLLPNLGIENAQGFRWGKPARPDMLPRILAAPVGLVPELAQFRPDRTHPEWRIE